MNNPTNAILSIMVLSILIVPIISMDYVIDNQKEAILEIGYDNYIYNSIKPINIDKPHFEGIIEEWNIIDETNTSRVIGFNYQGTPKIRDLQYSDNITYLGNDTYQIDISNFTYREYILIPLNLTTHNITKYDLAKSVTNAEITLINFEEDGTDNIFGFGEDEVTEDVYLYTIFLTHKIYLNGQVDKQAYLIVNEPTMDIITFTFGMGENKNESTFTISDMAQYHIILSSTIILSTFTLIFMTNVIDIKIDKKKQ